MGDPPKWLFFFFENPIKMDDVEVPLLSHMIVSYTYYPMKLSHEIIPLYPWSQKWRHELMAVFPIADHRWPSLTILQEQRITAQVLRDGLLSEAARKFAQHMPRHGIRRDGSKEDFV